MAACKLAARQLRKREVNLLMSRILLVGLCLATATWADPPSTIAIRNARIVTVSGPVIAKGTVVVRKGLIDAVGENVAVPADAWVIEGEGLTVYPGLIDGLSTWGIEPPATPPMIASGRGGMPQLAPSPDQRPSRGPEDRPMTTSWVRAADLVRPTDRRLELARNVGFTSAVTFPKTGIFAGQGSVINLAGEKPSDMIVAPSAGQYLTMTTGGFANFPGSLMGVIAYIRQVYLDADRYARVKKQYADNPRGLQRPEYDRALEGVLDSPRILLPAVRAVEIDRMLRFSAELKQKAVLYGAHEAYRASDRLKGTGVPVIVNLRWPEKPRETNPEDIDALRTLELRDRAPSTPAALAKAGVLFAFSADGLEQPRDVFRNVKKAMDAGLSSTDALKALTLNVAEIFGVVDRLGSIEKGKIANLVVVKGELLVERPDVKYTLIDGVKFEPVPEAAPAGFPGRAPSGVNEGGKR
jgi:imidazolonepropionase-like amidohydrolase